MTVQKSQRALRDFPGSGVGDGSNKSGGKSQGPIEEPKRPSNPWEQQKPEGVKPRGPSLEDLFRGGGGGGGKKGGGFGGLPQRADGKSWWPVIAIGLAVLLDQLDQRPPFGLARARRRYFPR